MKRKIIKLKEGDDIPEVVKLLYSEQVKVPGPDKIVCGFFLDDVYSTYRLVTYFYYEVHCETK